MLGIPLKVGLVSNQKESGTEIPYVRLISFSVKVSFFIFSPFVKNHLPKKDC